MIARNLKSLIVLAVALAALAIPGTARAQGGGNTPDPRPFALFRDLFDTAGEWHGPWVNMAWQPQVQWQWQSEGVPKNDVTTQVSWGTYVWFTPELTMNVNLTLDQVEQPTDNNQWFMYGEGITAGDVWVEWSDQRTGIIGGRFTAPFGLAPVILGSAVGHAFFFPNSVRGQAVAVARFLRADAIDAVFDFLREVLVCHDVLHASGAGIDMNSKSAAVDPARTPPHENVSTIRRDIWTRSACGYDG